MTNEEKLVIAHDRFVRIAKLLPDYEKIKGSPFEEVFKQIAEELPGYPELQLMVPVKGD